MSELSLDWVLANITDYANDAVLITEAEPIDEPGPRIVFANPTFTLITGYDASEVIGKSPRILQGPETSPIARRQIREALTAWRPVVAELVNYKKDGTPFWVELSIVPIADEDGRYQYWACIQRDTTQIRKHQHELKVRSLAMDVSTTAIAVCALEGDLPTVIYGNAPFTSLLGDAQGAGAAFLNVFPVARRGEIVDALKASLAHGRTYVSEEAITSPAGDELYARISVEPIPSEFLATPRLLVSIRDKTEEQARKEEIAEAQKLRAIGHMTGGVAHDFNNLLTIITHCADILLSKTGLDDDTRDLVQTISHTADRGAALTSQLLSFARRRPLETQRIDVGAFLERFQSVLLRVIPSSISVELCLEPDLDDIDADPAQLETALLNLVINARDAITTSGAIRLSATNKIVNPGEREGRSVPAGAYVSLCVADDGPGMTKEVVQRAFEPFFTTKDVGQGTGLGLSMVYGFVRQSKGDVKITSSPGSGTTVELLFPKSAQLSCETHAAQLPARSIDSRAIVVLVVEDNLGVLEYVAKLVRGLGCKTYSASSGVEALSVLQAHDDVDILFTDLVMAGGLSGIDLARDALVLRPALKILFTSGYSEEDPDVMRALSNNTPLLKKPYHTADLAHAITLAASGLQGAYPAPAETATQEA